MEEVDFCLYRNDREERSLFLPTSVSILILRSELNGVQLPLDDVQFGLGLELFGIDSVFLVLYCFEEAGRTDNNDNSHVTACESGRIMLDYFADIRRENVTQDINGHVTEILYNYRRFDEVVSFLAVVTGPNGNEELQALDFLLGQYCIKQNIIDRDIFVAHQQEDARDHNNIVAKGFENSGVLVRKVLKTSGQYTGHLIRYLGRKYTEAMVKPTENPMSLDEINPNLLAEAQRRREWAESFNFGARTVTSTILYPVRWTGQKAAKLAQVDHHLDQNLDTRERNLVTHEQQQTITSSASHSIKKNLWDTVEGMGNGVTSIFKGVTEAMSEVGTAIGDSAMHHARVKYGDAYADHVTKSYVDAASEIGLAGYKLTNVFSFGLAGLMIDVVVEGTTLLVSLYDYLVGPVILQGYVTLVQPPLLSPKRYFVVLRPWSISFYETPKDIIRKPFKIVPTFLLDTIPRLRWRKHSSSNGINASSSVRPGPTIDSNVDSHNVLNEDASEEIQFFMTPVQQRPPAPSSTLGTSDVNHDDSGDDEMNIIEADGLSYIMLPPTRQTHAAAENNAVSNHNNTNSNINTKLSSAMYHWSGGHRSHIELTTIDCSTYLLYPEISTTGSNATDNIFLETYREKLETELLFTWYHELETAVQRVETLAKRRSEAIQLAAMKREKNMSQLRQMEISPNHFIFYYRRFPVMDPNLLEEEYKNLEESVAFSPVSAGSDGPFHSPKISGGNDHIDSVSHNNNNHRVKGLSRMDSLDDLDEITGSNHSLPSTSSPPQPPSTNSRPILGYLFPRSQENSTHGTNETTHGNSSGVDDELVPEYSLDEVFAAQDRQRQAEFTRMLARNVSPRNEVINTGTNHNNVVNDERTQVEEQESQSHSTNST